MKPDTDELENFDQRCIDAWGAPIRSHKQRVKGQYLDEEGQAIRKIPTQLCHKAGLRMNQTQISQIKQAFLIYLYRNPAPLAKRLGNLERHLKLSKTSSPYT